MKSSLFAICVCGLIGCTGMTPVGPFAKEKPITQQGQPLPAAPVDPAARPTAYRPPAPTTYVKPDDVTADPYAAAAKFASELETDGKPVPNAPVTAEVSTWKGGVKQN